MQSADKSPGRLTSPDKTVPPIKISGEVAKVSARALQMHTQLDSPLSAVFRITEVEKAFHVKKLLVKIEDILFNKLLTSASKKNETIAFPRHLVRMNYRE